MFACRPGGEFTRTCGESGTLDNLSDYAVSCASALTRMSRADRACPHHRRACCIRLLRIPARRRLVVSQRRRLRRRGADALSRHGQAGRLVVRLQVQHQRSRLPVPAMRSTPASSAAACKATSSGASNSSSPAAPTRSCRQGSGCAGDSAGDPVGATFREVYNGGYYYVVWNDQFYDDPEDRGLHQGVQFALGTREGHGRLERGGRGTRDAGLDALVAGFGQQEVCRASPTATRSAASRTTMSR